MKKALLIVFILTGTAFSGFAQQLRDMHSFAVGLNYGVPFGDGSNQYSYMTGVTGKFEFPTKQNQLRVVVISGLDIYAVKDPGKKGDKDAFIPVEFGARIGVNKFYFEGDAGLSISTNSPSSNYTGQALGIMYSPTIGYCLPVLDMQQLDFSIRYEGRTSSPGTLNVVALRVAYRFNFLKRNY